MFLTPRSLRRCLRITPRSSVPASISQPRPLSQRHASQSTHHPPPQPKTASLPRFFVASLVLGSLIYHLYPRTPQTLNDQTFTPYTITARERVSSTSFILTIRPNHPSPPPYLDPESLAWRHAHWSVEFKQPEVQIARHYTPLPPLPGEDPQDGRLRFYVRAIGGGEMSNYLARLKVGDEVQLRGPHVGFELKERVGQAGDVVVLAGGTGIAPAMQVARCMLEETSVDVRVDWAVRRREEVGGVARGWSWWRRPFGLGDVDNPSAVTRQLVGMQARHRERFQVRVFVDEEGTFIRSGDVSAALKTSGTSQSVAMATAASGCRLHNQKLHEAAYEFNDAQVPCSCQGEGAKGKSLVVVSGPEGFIEYLAGKKVWVGGRETQGALGGVLGGLMKGNDKWLVIKM